jgi:N-acetylneuraminic acid mutarotase
MALKKICRARFQLVVAMLGCIAGMPAAHAQGTWQKVAPFPEPAEEILGAAAGGRMYVFAGLAPVWKPMGMVYEYDPASDKWTKKKPMALPSHHVALTEYHGKIYAFGGFVYPQSGPPAWVPINNAWEYDPATDTWKALAPMPIKRGSAVAAVVGDKIYVIGGVGNIPGTPEVPLMPTTAQISFGNVQEYNPAENTWRERSPMPTPRNHTTAGAINGRIYVAGGRVGAAFIGVASDVSVVEEYDPATDKWSAPRSRMPTARSALASGVYNGQFYVAGGEYQDTHMMATFKALEAFDPASNSWSIMSSMPVSRHGLAAGVIGNRLILVGGDVQSAGNGIMASTNEVDAFVFPGGGK